MKIRVHFRDRHAGRWETHEVEASQVPTVGEFLAPAPVKVFRVVMTLHVLFRADYDAEVFAELVDFEREQRDALGAVVWKA